MFSKTMSSDTATTTATDISLTDNDHVLEVLEPFFKAHELHQATIVYVYNIIQRLSNFIGDASKETIVNWLKETFSELDIDELIGALDDDDSKAEPVHLVLSFFAEKVIEAGKEMAEFAGDKLILPWDVKLGVQKNNQLNGALLKEPETDEDDDDTLEVTVVVNENTFVHKMNFELAYGLIIYSLYAEKDYKMTVFDSPFENGMYEKLMRVKEYSENTSKYVMTSTANEKFYFESESFIQGLLTGCLWEKDDFTNYVSVINEMENGEIGEKITF